MATWYEIIDKLSNKQRHVLGMIAMNEDGGHPPRTILSLLKLNLIVAYKEQMVGKGKSVVDRIPLTVTRYDVPTPVHIAWCEWCSKHHSEEDNEN
jgi:hypothetical protein